MELLTFDEDEASGTGQGKVHKFDFVPATFFISEDKENVQLPEPPLPTGRRGRPRLKGAKIGTPKSWAEQAVFTAHTVTRYNRPPATVHIAELVCLRYGSFHTRTVRVLLVRDPGSTKLFDLALVTISLTTMSWKDGVVLVVYQGARARCSATSAGWWPWRAYQMTVRPT
ncbi:hypothetical protein [Streptomyces sp. NPDC001139]